MVVMILYVMSCTDYGPNVCCYRSSLAVVVNYPVSVGGSGRSGVGGSSRAVLMLTAVDARE